MFVCHHWKLFDTILFLTQETMSQKHQKTLSKRFYNLSYQKYDKMEYKNSIYRNNFTEAKQIYITLPVHSRY